MKQNTKIFIQTLVYIFLSFLFTNSVTPLAQAIEESNQNNHLQIISFLNQVRGEECCDPGSLENLQTQINTFSNKSMTATFAIRYDALLDDRYTNTLTETEHEIAGLLEITPALAKAAGVSYKGDETNWYQARHAFLVGYTKDESRKLVDTYMQAFQDVFGRYPTTTSAWQIDATSLNYLTETYDTTTHQITRNQWGTDSYTMHGGPFHYPYMASQQWPFLPGESNTLIIRQTVSDPLRNYADHTASHTSQPNDYLQNKGFTYFENLLTQTLSQTHNAYSFALLGLENSMAQNFQEEFTRQIEWIHAYAQENENVLIIPAGKIHKSVPTEMVYITHGKNLTTSEDIEAIYFTTQNYQARLFREGEHLTITDFRLYSPFIHTYTKDAKSPSPNTYWIAPFAIDSSRSHRGKSVQTNFASKILKNIEPQLPDFPIYNPRSEIDSDYVGLTLPDIKAGESMHITPHKITYSGTDDALIEITANPEGIEINQAHAITVKADFQIDTETPFENFSQIKFIQNTLTWNDFFQLKISTGKKNTTLIPSMIAKDADISQQSRPAYFPGLTSTADNKASFLVAHNPITITNQNPIRIFAYTLGADQLPAYSPITVSSDNSTDNTKVHHPTSLTDMTWVDIKGAQHGKRYISARFDTDTFDVIPVYFVPDCKQDMKACLRHPSLAIKYFQLQISTKLKHLLRSGV